MSKLGVFLFLGAAAFAGACSKSGPGKVSGAASSAIDVMPKDTGFVGGFNAAKFRESKLWGALQGMMPAEAKTQLDTIKATCNIDMMNDFDSVIIGAYGDMSEDKVVVVVKGKWEEDKINACISPLGEKMNSKKVTVAKEGKVTTYTADGEKPMHVVWLDKNTMLVTGPAAKGDKASLTALLDAKETIKNNKEMMEMVGKADTGATVWGAGYMPGRPELGNISGQIATDKGEKVQGGWISITLGKALDASGGLRFDQAAQGVADKVGKEVENIKKMPQAASFVETLKVGAAGNDLTINWSLDEKKLDEAINQLKEALPALMMMMGG